MTETLELEKRVTYPSAIIINIIIKRWRKGGERGRAEREGREGGQRGRAEREGREGGREGGQRGRAEREGREGGQRGSGDSSPKEFQ